MVGSAKETADAIAVHFKRILAPENKVTDNISYPPTPFTGEEINMAAKSMKNGKGCGIDQVHGEHIKYSPANIHENIADILNTTAETGENPTE